MIIETTQLSVEVGWEMRGKWKQHEQLFREIWLWNEDEKGVEGGSCRWNCVRYSSFHFSPGQTSAQRVYVTQPIFNRVGKGISNAFTGF